MILFWIVICLTIGSIPCVVAGYRIRTNRRFRKLNQLILAASLGQILLPVAVMTLLALGFPPYAKRGEQRLQLVVSAFIVSFLITWLLMLLLGLLCAPWPKQKNDRESSSLVRMSILFGITLVFGGCSGSVGMLVLRGSVPTSNFNTGITAMIVGIGLLLAGVWRYRRS